MEGTKQAFKAGSKTLGELSFLPMDNPSPTPTKVVFARLRARADEITNQLVYEQR